MRRLFWFGNWGQHVPENLSPAEDLKKISKGNWMEMRKNY